METGASLGLKRRYEEVDQGSPFSLTPKDSDDDVSSSDSADSCDSLNPPSSSFTPTSILRRHKPSPGGKRVRFDVVTVYYFPRRQGFTSVPSQGGSSLGMARHHCSIRHYTLGEFAREQESSHRHTLRQHLRQEKLNARKMKLTRNGTVECAQAELLTLDDVSDEDLDVDGLEVDDCFFLQPLPTKRRRALLRASGISRIDAREKTELRAIRLSREECGCDCRLYCDPRHCGCSQAGIKCQVDRMSFPCGCSRDGCGNMSGRVEFNPLRVRTHYLHTIMKLDSDCRKILLHHSADDHFPQPSLATLRPASPDRCPGLGDEREAAAEEEEAGQIQDALDERDILERENETAVLHLQSAEERERRTREVLLQGPFPTGATVLCITEDQEEAHYNKEDLLYYQLSPIEAGAFEALPQEDEGRGLGGRNVGAAEVPMHQEEAKTAEEGASRPDIMITKQEIEELRCIEESRPPSTPRNQCQDHARLDQEVY
ncbi:cysteine/serine-rich nuclear protein 2 [Eucyclogobius newberryi]|uniref:cysteine/serine-rich nuclear protein 2 n=1 Tax=Eucyclogobius newberryi TaxID=166745 RepID=UPI003B58C22A